MIAPLAQQITYFKLIMSLITAVPKFIPVHTEDGRFYDPFKNLQIPLPSPIEKIKHQTVSIYIN